MNFIIYLCLIVTVAVSPSFSQYGLHPRIFYIPVNSGASSSSPHTEIAKPFLIPGQSCTGVHWFTGKVMAGTCQKYLSCVFRGRYIGGACSLGIKSCCIPKDETVVITGPSSGQSKSYAIHPFSNQYCQLRLDFDVLTIGDPNDGGTCSMSEQFVVSGQKSPHDVPTLCGKIGETDTQQHMYLEFQTSPSKKRPTPITISITTSESTSKWTIRATQIMCNDVSHLAPSGCLQFYNVSTGNVESFNYVATTGTPTKTYQLNKMNYKICLKPSDTKVTWTQDASLNSFILSGTAAGTDARAPFYTCPNDYVFIRNGKNYIDDLAERTCGTGFSDITASANPLELQYVTDSNELNDVHNKGFRLHFSSS